MQIERENFLGCLPGSSAFAFGFRVIDDSTFSSSFYGLKAKRLFQGLLQLTEKRECNQSGESNLLHKIIILMPHNETKWCVKDEQRILYSFESKSLVRIWMAFHYHSPSAFSFSPLSPSHHAQWGFSFSLEIAFPLLAYDLMNFSSVEITDRRPDDKFEWRKASNVVDCCHENSFELLLCSETQKANILRVENVLPIGANQLMKNKNLRRDNGANHAWNLKRRLFSTH